MRHWCVGPDADGIPTLSSASGSAGSVPVCAGSLV